MKPVAFLLMAGCLCSPQLHAQTMWRPLPPDSGPSHADTYDGRLRIDLTLLDLPYNVAHGVRGPSMQQALDLTTGFYEGSHQLIQRAWGERTLAAWLSITLWDYFTLALPLADAWLHEEFHRAVLGHRGIDSFNDVYRFNLGAETIAVSHVRDEDLIRLKRDHPAEQVRLGSAGMEGEHLLIQQLQANRFFHGSTSWNIALYWLLKAGSAGYVMSGTWQQTNDDTDEMNRKDGARVEVRDFTGHDFTAWVYDLHRPHEAYADRGVHPSGVGIDRYIKPSDLTAEELAYLKRQGRLQLVNFLDPQLFGLNEFALRNPLNGGLLRFQLSAGHVLTSFGHSLHANLFLAQDDVRLHVVVHSYENGHRRFPGVDAKLVEYPVRIAGTRFLASPRIAGWLQPPHSEFDTSAATAGALGALRVSAAGRGAFNAWGEVEAKSAGWVAGHVDLGRAAALRVGGTLRL